MQNKYLVAVEGSEGSRRAVAHAIDDSMTHSWSDDDDDDDDVVLQQH